MSIILLGKPGCGKGTQGDLICERLEYTAIIAGDLLRKERDTQSKLGLEIQSRIDKGNLVPDEMVSSIVATRISQLCYAQGSTRGYLFDGYPRSIKQAERLDHLYKKYIILEPVDYAILLEVPEDILTERIIERGESSGRADDQDKSIVKTRMKNYRRETEPIIGYYEDQGKLIRIDGDRDIEEIFNDIKQYIPKPNPGYEL